MHFTLRPRTSLRAGLAAIAMVGCSPAFAESAYITQVNPGATSTTPGMPSQPVQMIPAAAYAPHQAAFVPTPETTRPARNGNVAETIQIGSFNRVSQSQSGGNNFSNVGVIGGKDNNVGVWQAGRDFSNLNLINTQGLSVAVIQPPGAAPLNMLIARLPNGGLLVKR